MSHNPWPGLASYTENNPAHPFCGRDEAIKELTISIEYHNFTTLYGRSGNGKTSLLQAGIYPNLRSDGFLPIAINMREMAESRSTYTEFIVSQTKAMLSKNGVEHQIETAEDNGAFPDFFANLVIRDSQKQRIIPVIVLDQFEQCLANTDHVKQLLEAFYTIAEDFDMVYKKCLRVVVSIREDDLFLIEDLIDQMNLSVLKANRYRLRSLSPEEVRQVILTPARKAHCIEPCDENAVAEAIGRYLTQNGNKEINTLILSLICSELYTKGNGKITSQLLNDIGDDMLCTFFERVCNDCKIKRSERRFIEQNMVDPEGRRQIVKKGILKNHVNNIDEQRFTGNNAIFHFIDPSKGDDGYVELIHDKLATAIVQLNKRRVARVNRFLLGVACAALLGAAVLFLFPRHAANVVSVVVSNSQQVNIVLIEDSASFADDAYWEMRVRLRWTRDSAQHDTLVSRSRPQCLEPITLFIDSATGLSLSLFIPEEYQYLNIDTLGIPSYMSYNDLVDNGMNIRLPVKRKIVALTGRAVAVINDDTIPIRDENVFYRGEVARTNSQGQFTFMVPKNSKDNAVPCMWRDGLAQQGPATRDSKGNYLFVFDITSDTAAFFSGIEEIRTAYLAAAQPTDGSKKRDYGYAFDTVPYAVRLRYTKPDANGQSRGYFFVCPGNKKLKHDSDIPYYTYFLGKGQFLNYEGTKGLRNFTFYGKDCAGNEAVLRSVVSNGKMYVYIYLPPKERMFIKKYDKISGIRD